MFSTPTLPFVSSSSATKLMYDYPPLEIAHREQTLGTIKFPLIYDHSTTQCVKFPENIGYRSRYVTITTPIHQVANVEAHGEIIIEHVPWTNVSGSLFVCLFIVSKPLIEPTVIDTILSGRNTTLSLNELLASTSSIMYRDGNHTIVILPIAIPVATDLSMLTPLDKPLFAPFSSNSMPVLWTPHSVEGMDSGPFAGAASQSKQQDKENDAVVRKSAKWWGFREGLANPAAQVDTGANVNDYLECQPVDASDEAIQSIMVPSQSLYTPTVQSMIAYSVYLFGFVFVLGFCYLIMPPIYEGMEKLNVDKQQIQHISLLYRYAFFFIALGLVSTTEPLAMSMGLAMLVAVLLASFVHNVEPRILDVLYPKSTTTPSPAIKTLDITELGNLFNPTEWLRSEFYFVAVLFIVMIILLILVIVYFAGSNNMAIMISAVVFGSTLALFPTVYLIIRAVYNKPTTTP